jgi:hypothetical protein
MSKGGTGKPGSAQVAERESVRPSPKVLYSDTEESGVRRLPVEDADEKEFAAWERELTEQERLGWPVNADWPKDLQVRGVNHRRDYLAALRKRKGRTSP